jgi:ubiquitin-conjugating enzyme E2 variant
MARAETDARLPAIDASAGAQRWLWLAAIAAAFAALAALAVRIVIQVDLWQWWVPAALVAGILLADFGSGLVHWSADTWGRDDLIVIGPRLLVPFRVHHVNPDDFLRRNFADTNGDVALIAIAPLVSLTLLPLGEAWQVAVAAGGFGLCGAGMLTNQIHQWAHMPSPPRLVRILQDAGVILGRHEHAVHHRRPYDVRYCITTGWCNRPLEAAGFFRALERTITRVTGARPRHDDERYDERYARGIPSFASHD